VSLPSVICYNQPPISFDTLFGMGAYAMSQSSETQSDRNIAKTSDPSTESKATKRIGWVETTGAVVLLANFGVSAANFVVMWHYQAPTFLAAEQLSAIDGALKTIELSIAETKNKLAVQQSQVVLASDTLRVIESIAPKLEIAPLTSDTIGLKDMTVTWEVKNEGDFGFLGGSFDTYFSTSPIIHEQDVSKSRLLKYEITSKDELGYLSPKSHGTQSVHLHWPDGWPKLFYYYIKLVVQTEDDIVEVTKRGTGNVFDDAIDTKKVGWVAVNGEVRASKGNAVQPRRVERAESN
jgi:hypothetical protein